MISIKFFFQNKKYFASAFLYCCFSLIFSTWVTYIPQVAEKIGITEGRIGKAIFFYAMGSLLIIRICRILIDKAGVGRYTYFALLAYCLSFFGPFLAFNYTSLCISLFIFGMASSSYAISLNSLTAIVEKQDGVYIMSGSHGFWSLGGMIGSAAGSFIAAMVKNPLVHIFTLVLIIQIIQLIMRPEYYNRKAEPQSTGKSERSRIIPLITIALTGLIVMVSEGAVADWSALYLKKIILIDNKFIGFGYSAFSLAMMTGRFSGDSLSKQFGSWQLITYSSLIAICGFLLVLVLIPALSILGFFIVGLGFSVIVPEVYRLASNVKGVRTSEGVSFIAVTTNLGFLVGPVVLGFIAEIRSLHLSFSVLTVFVTIAFIISFYKNSKSKSESNG